MASQLSAAGAAGHLTAHQPGVRLASSSPSYSAAPDGHGCAAAEKPVLTADTRKQLRALIDQERRRLENAPADGIRHGTHGAYKRGCRCDECREHQRVGRQRRRQNQQRRFVYQRRFAL